ncbi:calumenin-like [Oculina patagonica]
MYRVLIAYCLALLLCVCTLKVLAAEDTSNEHKEDSTEATEEMLKKGFGSIILLSDTDKDGKVTLEELTAWTKKSLRSVYKREAKERLKKLDTNEDGKVSWEEYLKSKEDVGGLTEEQKKRRFNHADTDKDELLSQDEINSMFHPEEKAHMLDVIVDEYIEMADTDKDGRLTIEEYKKRMFKGGKENEKAADKFFKQQDKNQDGNIDREEMKLWLKSINTASLAKKEAERYIKKADDNKDGTLSQDEIENHVDLFLDAAKEQQPEQKAKEVKDEL